MQMMEMASWEAFESLITSKKLLCQYSETESVYELFAPEASTFLWHITLLKGSADSDDFEDNHKSMSNKPLDVRSSASRPARVAASPQPDGTTERWKGYEIDCGANDSTKAIDISFGSLIYLRGGTATSDDVAAGDKFKVEIQMQINSVWTTIMTPMEDIFMLPGKRVEVVSPECMEFPTIYRMKVTFTPAQTGTQKKIYLILDYYA